MITEPKWIAEIFKIKSGQDHLGLGSVSSDHILEEVIPGIIALSPHPRYLSFYTFLLDEFWSRNLNKSANSFIKFFRPRDFIFSLGANSCLNEEHNFMNSIIGSEKTSPLAKKQLDFYNTIFDYIKSPLSGYGLYYRSVIARLGWIIPGGVPPYPPIDAPTAIGKKAAELFRHEIKDTKYYNQYFNEDNIDIPIDVIKEFGNKACLCQLAKEDSLERNYILYYLIGNTENKEAEARRKTFKLFLDISKQIQGIAITDDIFRQLIYFKETMGGFKYTPSENVRSTFLKWRLYQAREYYSFALNCMWHYLCSWGIKNLGFLGINISEFWDHITNDFKAEKFTELLKIATHEISIDSKYYDLLDWLKQKIDLKNNFDGKFLINSEINEYKLYRLAVANRNSLEVMVFDMLVMLSIIFLRFKELDQELKEEWYISKMGGTDRLSLDYFINSLKVKLKNEDVTIMEILKWLFSEFIIKQHIKIASNKLPENTFRFIKEGDKLIFFNIQNSSTRFNTARFEAISTTLFDLGLCNNFNSGNHNLTDEGLKILNGET